MVKRTKSRRSVRRKAAPKRKATKRKAPAKRKATKRKATKRKAAPKRKATKRKAPAKRKATPKRKVKRSTPKKPRYSLLITQSQRNSRDFKVQVLKNGKVTGEPKKIVASKISKTTSGIINYARRKRVNLSKAWDSVA
ncbi:MAG: hypothetical protein ACJZ58_02120 [Nitrososphaerales archaeon]